MLAELGHWTVCSLGHGLYLSLVCTVINTWGLNSGWDSGQETREIFNNFLLDEKHDEVCLCE